MNRHRFLITLISFAVLGLLAGCEEEVSPPPVAAPQKVAAPPASQTAAPAPEVVAPPPERYVYDPSGRRDPFEPLTAVKKPIVQKDTPLTPLENFDLGQLRLIGVIVGKGESTAMVVAPDGKSYILKRGVKIGRNNGKVIEIKPDAVLVEERYYDFSGEVRKSVESIQLPKREGV